jgi:hypothetical protein
MRLSSTTITLDSMYQGNGKTLYTYNSQGQNTTIVYYYTTTSVPSERIEFNFDSLTGKLLSYEDLNWNSIDNTWKKWEKQTFSYDNLGNRKTLTILDWNDTTASYDSVYKYSDVYLASGKLLSEIGFVFDRDNNTWISADSKENTYDVNGNLTERIAVNFVMLTYEPVLHIWERPTFREKIQYAYDSLGNNTLTTLYYWNPISSAWENSEQDVFSYGGFNEDTLEVNYEWSSKLKKWVTYSKTEKMFDSHQQVISSIYSTMDTLTFTWKPFSKDVFNYDPNRNLKYRLEYRWNSSSQSWQNQNTESYSYDSIQTSMVTLPFFWSYPTTGNRIMNYQNQQYNFSSAIFYYSDEFTTDLPRDPYLAENTSIYPNPCTEYVELTHISLEGNCRLFDATGQSQPCTLISPTRIDMKSFPAGIYPFKIEDKKPFKIVKQ